MGISLNVNLSKRSQRFELDISHLPVVAQRKKSRLLGVFIVIFALVWGGFPVAGIAAILSGDQAFEPAMIVFLLFPLLGLGIFAFGVHQLVWRKTITLDRDFVTVVERGLRGAKQWREQLANYTGVLQRTRRVRTKNSSYTLYIVDLIHEDDSKKINLYTDTGEAGHRAKWEAYARALELPALEQGQGGVLRREAADLDKSVGELIGEGKVEIDFDALTRTAKGLSVDYEGDTVVLTRTGPKHPWWGMLIGVTFPLVFVAVALMAPGMPWFMRILFGGLGAVFEIVFVLGVLWDLVSRQRIRVGPRDLKVSTVSPWGEKEGKQMPIGGIENVTIARDSNGASPAVVMAGDADTLKFGSGLSGSSLDFVMNTVLAKVAEAERYNRR